MEKLCDKVEINADFPERGSYQLYHSDDQEFRAFDNNEKIKDYLEINDLTSITKIYIGEKSAAP